MEGYAVVTNYKTSVIKHLNLTSFSYYITIVGQWCVCVVRGDGMARSSDLHSHSRTKTDEGFNDFLTLSPQHNV